MQSAEKELISMICFAQYLHITSQGVLQHLGFSMFFRDKMSNGMSNGIQWDTRESTPSQAPAHHFEASPTFTNKDDPSYGWPKIAEKVLSENPKIECIISSYNMLQLVNYNPMAIYGY